MTPPGFLTMVTMRTTPSMTTTVFVNPRLRPTGALMDTSVWVSANIAGILIRWSTYVRWYAVLRTIVRRVTWSVQVEAEAGPRDRWAGGVTNCENMKHSDNTLTHNTTLWTIKSPATLLHLCHSYTTPMRSRNTLTWTSSSPNAQSHKTISAQP